MVVCLSKHLQMWKRRQTNTMKKKKSVRPVLMMISRRYTSLLHDFPKVIYWWSMGKVATILKFPKKLCKVGVFFPHLCLVFHSKMDLSEWIADLASTLPHDSQIWFCSLKKWVPLAACIHLKSWEERKKEKNLPFPLISNSVEIWAEDSRNLVAVPPRRKAEQG